MLCKQADASKFTFAYLLDEAEFHNILFTPSNVVNTNDFLESR